MCGQLMRSLKMACGQAIPNRATYCADSCAVRLCTQTNLELRVEVLKEFIEVDEEKLKKQVEGHQELSRAGSEQKFKGGLVDTSDMSVKYHTATHLL